MPCPEIDNGGLTLTEPKFWLKAIILRDQQPLTFDGQTSWFSILGKVC